MNELLAKHKREVKLAHEIAQALEPHIEANPDATITNMETANYSTCIKLKLKDGRSAIVFVILRTEHTCEPNPVECETCHGDGTGS